ncbi:hypothetical protein Hamer_G025363 [Homarus americanus]|uniref:Uncharacterized protein n=1 Tax=Homarus americanus TaxID=6706 RepID=A0A8J5JVH3_HOMAM|nr:hypothetical protein Hamer_G025363 [Homarus americanus]
MPTILPPQSPSRPGLRWRLNRGWRRRTLGGIRWSPAQQTNTTSASPTSKGQRPGYGAPAHDNGRGTNTSFSNFLMLGGVTAVLVYNVLLVSSSGTHL